MDTSGSVQVSTKLQRIAELARGAPQMVLTTLAHQIDLEFLREAYRRTRKDGAVGVDGQTEKEYAANLEENLRSLLDRFKSGTYRAPPVRRVHIPKGDGKKTRPIGIPTFEDKILQRAVTMVLEAVYEQDFLDCSFGFRPGRSAHQALDALWRNLMNVEGGWVIDLDIQGFFDALDHGHLRSFLDHRVRDGVLRRIIGKWLKAGVMEAGQVSYAETGSPQGGVISPILANLYLHEVLDTWFERDVKPRLTGRAYLTRYADDVVIVCANAKDAQRVMAVLPKRFGRFELTLHPEKTRLVDFRSPGHRTRRKEESDSSPGVFDFLGFTHYWGRTRRGGWAVMRKTAKNRFGRAVQKIAQWCRDHLHLPVSEQHRVLSLKLMGHDAYYGITGNYRALARLRTATKHLWFKWLGRRSNSKRMRWDRFNSLLKHYPLPPAKVVHSALKPRVVNACP